MEEHQEMTQESVKVTRSASPAVTMRSFKGLVINIEELKLLDEKDRKTIKELYNKAMKQYMGFELL